MSLQGFTLTLAGGATARAVRVAPGADLAGLAEALALPPTRGTIAVVGGAKGFDAPEFDTLRRKAGRLLAELADFAAEKGLAVVDGGTPHGVMRLLGEARAARGDGFPLIGVAPLGGITWTDRPSGEGGDTPLDANHSAFVLVEADSWGDEAETLAAAAHALGGGQPTLEILVNGGEVARDDAWFYVRRGGALVTVEGSGRFADELASALKQGQSGDEAIQATLDSGRVYTFALDSPPGAFAARLASLLEAQR
jgi:hypothetical protein